MNNEVETCTMHHTLHIGAETMGNSKRFLRMAGIATCALLLVACQSNKREITGSVPDDYRLRHPITLQQSAKTIDVPVGMHSEDLTPASRSAISGFARDFLRERAAVIQIMVPSGAQNESSAQYVARKIRSHLMRQGVAHGRIDMIPYSALDATDAPIRLAYPRIEAKTLTCGTHPEDLAMDMANRTHFDFGCSTQQNFAAMVANPQDLVQPRGWDARDSSRRSVISEKYRNGEPTWSEDLGADTGKSSKVK
ncbi:pilus assembly protein CpaD [Cohaesibacter sp. ES.047]|uniref:CpaD family pilus assembly protein n=1 Tax=Cohaesibacter sp. ES.047 TaxID=1798205 RepID=UPI000BB6991B|nr:CpaD family pilus assembly protein [Cohaesibacter sp. ES.047]SNY91824.1 pilus assembly protein CpaD [Cohaesibacter sp. ES.047]